MKTTARGIVSCVSIIFVALASIAASASAQTKSFKDQLVGHWQLVSISINGTQPYGEHPQGSMFIDADGHYSVIVLSNGKARNISYYGTYSVGDDGVASIHVDGSNLANAIGHDEKRIVKFQGDELIIESDVPSGSPGAVTLGWKKG